MIQVFATGTDILKGEALIGPDHSIAIFVLIIYGLVSIDIGAVQRNALHWN